MRIGLVPYKYINNDVEYNIGQIEKALNESLDKVDLLCFGESFLQGFDSLRWNYEADKDIAITSDALEMTKLRQWSKDYNTAILFGYIERDGNRIYSSCAVMHEGELICNYRRISTGWKESSKTDEHYQEGTDIKTFELKNKKISIVLCGDLWEYPDRFKTDKLLIWPVYVNYNLNEWIIEEKEYATQAGDIAKEVLMINSLSDDPVSHGGAFYFKEGKVADRITFDSEEILIVDV